MPTVESISFRLLNGEPRRSTLFPYTTLFRSSLVGAFWILYLLDYNLSVAVWVGLIALAGLDAETGDRKSTRLNSSHEWISYAVFCLKKKKDQHDEEHDGEGDSRACGRRRQHY